ncbi:MAG: phosphatidylglycerophosphatase A [Pseudomonadota bacterium]
MSSQDRELKVKPTVFRSPAQFLAFGFGSGLSPRAPGTVGTLLAALVYLPIVQLGLPAYTLFTLFAAVFGVWVCGVASQQLRVHDHPGIVWDEFVGFWITMWALPNTWPWVVSGFLLFRIFDIFKPWPISLLDKTVPGGLGIVIDDILAGVLACAVLHGVLWVL